MPKQDSITQLDTHQINKRVFDQEHDATRVVLALDHAMEMALDASDDSVQAVPRSRTLDGSEVKCDDLKGICVYVRGDKSVDIEVSPVDEGDVWFLHSANTQNDILQIRPVCARRIRFKQPDGVQVFVVGQS
jgi:hypothetical protein